MASGVNPRPRDDRLRRARVARTEQAIITAATGLFLADGYTATTLAAVAEAAQVGARTVYVRFGTKAALLKRVVDVAVVGDSEPVDVLGRDPARTAMTAPTAAERITAMASAARQIMQRTGALFAVAQQAAAVEPLIAEYWQQGRQQTRHVHHVIWTQMARDGLLKPPRDLDRITDAQRPPPFDELGEFGFDVDVDEAEEVDVLAMAGGDERQQFFGNVAAPAA
jgi:AcrR family transcriptional regulator